MLVLSVTWTMILTVKISANISLLAAYSVADVSSTSSSLRGHIDDAATLQSHGTEQ